MGVHYTDKYLMDPVKRVTVNVIGCGGTGSQVLGALGRMHMALVALGHCGLMVRVWDADMVTAANVGRQAYSTADVGMNKAVVAVGRVNRFYGLDWMAVPVMYGGRGAAGYKHDARANITVSCVDTAAGRIAIGKCMCDKRERNEPDGWMMYWMDFGNLARTGQVVLGTVGEIAQVHYHGEKSNKDFPPKDADERVGVLKDVVAMFPNMGKIKEKDLGPSCSLAEALGKQDLFINSALVQLGMNLLWKLFREGRIQYHGMYLNLDSMSSKGIKV